MCRDISYAFEGCLGRGVRLLADSGRLVGYRKKRYVSLALSKVFQKMIMTIDD